MKKFVSRRSFLKAACITAAVMPMLTGCTKKEKSEKEILKDLQAEDSLYQECGLKIDSSEITKRQTNPDSKTDYVWISVSASNSDFIYNVDYELEYCLYNDGWLLEYYWRDDYDYTPLSYPTEEDALSYLETQYDNCTIEIVGSSFENGSSKFVAERSETDGYLTVIYQETLSYNNFNNAGWSVHLSDPTVLMYSFDFLGEWTYSSDGKNFYMNIESFDIENGTITLEYNFDGWATSDPWHTEVVPVSNGVVTKNLKRDSFKTSTYDKVIKYWVASLDQGLRISFSPQDVSLGDKDIGVCFFTKS